MAKTQTLPTLNTDETVEQQELSVIATGMQNGAATLEDGLAISEKSKHSYHINQPFYSHIYTHKKWKTGVPIVAQ